MKHEWKKIGNVSVDSGQLMVCDPCYIDSEWREEDVDFDKPNEHFSYNGACSATNNPNGAGGLRFKGGHLGAAVAFESGDGDGMYPVFARYVGGRVAEVRIVFNLDDEELDGNEP